MRKILLLALWLATMYVYVAQGQSNPPCPPESITCCPYLSVGVYRSSGQLVGSGYVSLGENLYIQACVASLSWDWFNDTPAAAFCGGQIFVGNVNVTPAGGVPPIGLNCGGISLFRSAIIPYVVSPADVIAGRIVVRARYVNGISLANGLPVQCSGLRVTQVRR